MSLDHLLMEEGVELELAAEMKELIQLLDSEVPGFTCEGYGYSISSMKGTLGSSWSLMVKPSDRTTGVTLAHAVVLIEIEALGSGYVSFRMPPRTEWGDDESTALDPDGKLFASFVFHVLNAFQRRSLVDFPGSIPIA